MYKWIAKYKDDDELHQFNGDKESLFSDIRQDDLKEFIIENDNNKISVNLINGTFKINNNKINVQDFSNLDEKYRLIYFRRVTRTITVDVNDDVSSIVFYIGFQVTINGVNHVRLLACSGDEITFVIRK